jgi:hypothetical protein
MIVGIVAAGVRLFPTGISAAAADTYIGSGITVKYTLTRQQAQEQIEIPGPLPVAVEVQV